MILHILFLSQMFLMKAPGLWRCRRGHKHQKELVQPSEPCERSVSPTFGFDAQSGQLQ